MKRIYFDENIPVGLAHGMSHLDKANNNRGGKCELLYLPDELGKSIKDPDWIPILAAEQAVIITKDTTSTARTSSASFISSTAWAWS